MRAIPTEVFEPGPLPAARQVIEECRANFGSPPRSFPSGELDEYLGMPMPDWFATASELPKQRHLLEVFAQHGTLLRHGRVVWGAFIQANTYLFRPGTGSHPASLVYSLDPRADDDPAALRSIGLRIYQLKDTKHGDPELQRLADSISDDYHAIARFEVPAGLTPLPGVFHTSTIITRRHLPGRVVEPTPFPLIVYPEQTAATMILPSRFWPLIMRTHWLS